MDHLQSAKFKVIELKGTFDELVLEVSYQE